MTRQAVERHLQALGCERYEVRIRGRGGRMLARTWTLAQVLASTFWLRLQNVRGGDIFIRPAQGVRTGLILVDGIRDDQLDNLRQGGLAPALVTQVAPGRYQAWIRLPEASEAERARFEERLAIHFKLNLSLDERGHPWGWLAGYTGGQDDGRSPFIQVQEDLGAEAPAGARLLDRMRNPAHAQAAPSPKPPFVAEDRVEVDAVEAEAAMTEAVDEEDGPAPR